MLGGAQISDPLVCWRCGLTDTCAGCPAELSPHIPRRATHRSVCQCCVRKGVAEQQGEKQDLCSQRQVEPMAQKMVKDCCGAGTGRRMYAGRSHEKIFFQAP